MYSGPLDIVRSPWIGPNDRLWLFIGFLLSSLWIICRIFQIFSSQLSVNLCQFVFKKALKNYQRLLICWPYSLSILSTLPIYLYLQELTMWSVLIFSIVKLCITFASSATSSSVISDAVFKNLHPKCSQIHTCQTLQRKTKKLLIFFSRTKLGSLIL